MDIDISDILADVSRPALPSSTSTSTTTTAQYNPQAIQDPTSTLSDHQLLTRAWISERCSPSLLPYPAGLLDRTTHRIRHQITRIEDLTSGVGVGVGFGDGPSTTGMGTGVGSGTGPNANLVLSILQTDLGRTQFLVRSYLRQRLAKVTKHALYYFKQHQQQQQQQQQQEERGQRDDKSGDRSALLSPAELAFLSNHQALLSRFYDDSFLGAFPANLRRLDDRAGGIDMVEGPDLGGAVVVRCLAETWGNGEEMDRGFDDDDGGGEDGDGPTTELRMGKGEVWVVRWRDVRSGVVGGGLELL